MCLTPTRFRCGMIADMIVILLRVLVGDGGACGASWACLRRCTAIHFAVCISDVEAPCRQSSADSPDVFTAKHD